MNKLFLALIVFVTLSGGQARAESCEDIVNEARMVEEWAVSIGCDGYYGNHCDGLWDTINGLSDLYENYSCDLVYEN
jgi:hypothetical protein